MARIAGINIPQNKVVSIALTYIHGIGLHSSRIICKKLNIPTSTRVNELTEDQVLKIREFIEKNFEYVGKDFSKRVREIYYDKKSNKTIYGTTTLREREELKEEGRDLLSIPWVDKNN